MMVPSLSLTQIMSLGHYINISLHIFGTDCLEEDCIAPLKPIRCHAGRAGEAGGIAAARYGVLGLKLMPVKE
jgi:hypothetical protein